MPRDEKSVELCKIVLRYIWFWSCHKNAEKSFINSLNKKV